MTRVRALVPVGAGLPPLARILFAWYPNVAASRYADPGFLVPAG